MGKSGRDLLEELERLRLRCGPEHADEKAGLIRLLAGKRLASADEVLRLHETLVFIRAYPDDAEVLSAAEDALRGFSRRSDLLRFRRSLEDTGVAGTRMTYAFSFPMARWLTRRGPSRIVWKDWERRDDLDELLPVLAATGEVPGVDDESMSGREWLDNATPADRGDAATLVARLERVSAEDGAREHLYNQLEVPLAWELLDGPDSRTLARWPTRKVAHQVRDPDLRRPNLRRALLDAPRVRRVDERTGALLVDLARGTMSVRIRELEAFDYGDPRDAWISDVGRGLSISVVGMLPSRRLMPEALYSGLFLKNGVPAGYWLASALFETSEVALNVFPTFRGGESAWMYGRLLALLHSFFGIVSFTIPRYQIGHDNDEAIGSGAFWFYRKLGMQSVDPEVRRLTREEEVRIRAEPGYRSPPATLRRLVVENMAFHLDRPRDDLVGIFPYGNLGHQVTRLFARRGGRSPAVERAMAAEAEALLGVRGRNRWPIDERRAFTGWAPVVLLLPRVSRWGAESKRSLVRIIRAKGAKHEVEFIRLSNRHAPFRRAVQKLCLSWTD
jgi:hypothetical protein